MVLLAYQSYRKYKQIRQKEDSEKGVAVSKEEDLSE
jgi:hypothetical protein